MQTVEVTGKTVEEATETAATKLGVSAENLLITVLDESKKLFGKSQVRIRAEKIEPQPATEPKSAPKKATKVEEASEPETSSVATAKPSRAKRPSAKAVATEEAPEAPEEESVSEEDNSAPSVAEIIATEEDGEKFLAIVNDLTETGSLEVTAHVSNLNGKYVTIELDGKDVAYLIGRHGEVLNAFQSLVNIIGGKKLNNGVRVTIDGNNYREKREASLQVMARKIAEEVTIRKEEAVLDPLPAFERRIVHKILAEMDGVTTYSEGEEPNRHVVIAPKD